MNLLSFAVCLLLLNFIWNFIFSYNINNVCESPSAYFTPRNDVSVVAAVLN